MNIFNMILKEVSYRKFNFLLSLLAVLTAMALLSCFYTISQASDRETTRLMRDMGYNLRIVHKDTDMLNYWEQGYSDKTLPEEYAYRFAQHKNLSFTHLLATLKQRIQWDGLEVILVGMATELSPPDQVKPSMTFAITPGDAYLGYDLAEARGLEKGKVIKIGEQELKVASILKPTGTEEDTYLFTHLSDAQAILNKPREINEIKALDCLCRIPGAEPIDVLRSELDRVFPEAKVFQISSIATARDRQRKMLEKYIAVILPVVLLACAVWLGAMAMQNTRDRLVEIGVLRALGYSSSRIGMLFFGKFIILGIGGAVLGFFIGTLFALQMGPDIFLKTAKNIQPEWSVFYLSLVLAPVFTALSGFIPAMVALNQDPADALRSE